MTGELQAAFLINWLFWSGVAIGAIVFAALLELVDGQWGAPLLRAARRFRLFLPISWIAYLALTYTNQRIPARGAVALAATYAIAFWFCGAAPPARTRASISLLVVYAAGFSIVAHDLMRALEPTWVSTLFPAYVFTANVYGGVAAAAVALLIVPQTRSLQGRPMRDLSMVLVAFALLWMYLVWSQFLVIWYGNLPDETAYVLRRSVGVWRSLAWVVFITRFVCPLVVLLVDGGRHRWVVLSTCVLIAAGFWVEYSVVVGPAITDSLEPVSTTMATVSSAALFLAFILPVRAAVE